MRWSEKKTTHDIKIVFLFDRFIPNTFHSNFVKNDFSQKYTFVYGSLANVEIVLKNKREKMRKYREEFQDLSEKNR